MAARCNRIPQHHGRGGDIKLATAAPIRIERLRVVLRGAVQGVGFRPAVYRLAGSLTLAGWVRNSGTGLEIEVEGSSEQLDRFLQKLKAERPRAAVVTMEEISRIAPTGSSWFEILPSNESVSKTAAVLPDLGTCPECLRELLDPGNRRFAYAFTNCTLCGPRHTILNNIPYDRPNTTMRGFVLCPACRLEYESAHDRRFHAQPNACPTCGPRLWSVPEQLEGTAAIAHAAEALARGEIVALKGIGGFQLLVDARNPAAVIRLRERKHREEKPFALLMPSVALARQYCMVSAAEEELLISQAAPIVLLRPKGKSDLAPEVAASSPYLGVMLPYSPLHHLLMAQFPFPVVATSGNRADEPLAVENDEALERLKGIADVFVLHNRPIARPCDDSVARISGGHPQILRRARGYAPLPVVTPRDLPPVLAVGGHLKNTVAIALGRQVFLSQHLGDLDSVESRQAFERTIEDLCRLYRFEPKLVACDLHADYASTQWALASGLPVVQIQHHHAHVAACAAENGIETTYLGIAWDGTGLGLDGTIWGGEFFVVRPGGFERIAHLRPFRLPGGEAAIRDCSRPAAGLIWETCGPDDVERFAGASVRAMLKVGINAPWSSSVGRLFDAVAFLIGVAQRNRFEGQAAMCLERAIADIRTTESYEISSQGGTGDWAPLTEALLSDRRAGVDVGRIAVKFHNALANWILAVAQTTDQRTVVLSGGVFQNAYLTSRATTLLESHGFRVVTHHQVPANDGGIALGQAFLAGKFGS
ncbi:MAG TPA: carbamoyltransferase HypF [Candidatus Sulfotelmatobacter sp.]|nr:carbamoyltransferase HypF [Candidatus Sulfotelmatobacter sp.]